MRLTTTILRAFAASLACAAALPALAIDGVVLIDQNKALAGGVTSGDAPGFPVSINTGGSYKLSSNLTVPNANTNAIVVSNVSVSIDLNGFAIIGPAVCSYTLGFHDLLTCAPVGTGVGVQASAAINAVVQNGTIRGMGASALSLGESGTVQDMFISSNGGGAGAGTATAVGAILAGEAIIRRNQIRANGGSAIELSGAGHVSDNLILYNSGGVTAGPGSSVINNTLRFNYFYGLRCDAASLNGSSATAVNVTGNNFSRSGFLNGNYVPYRLGVCFNGGGNACNHSSCPEGLYGD